MQDYTLEAEFGTATDNFTNTGRVVERSTYGMNHFSFSLSFLNLSLKIAKSFSIKYHGGTKVLCLELSPHSRKRVLATNPLTCWSLCEDYVLPVLGLVSLQSIDMRVNLTQKYGDSYGDSKLAVDVNVSCLNLFVSPATEYRPVQGVLHLLSYGSSALPVTELCMWF